MKMVSAPYVTIAWTIQHGISRKNRNKTASRFSSPGITATRTG